MTRCDAAAGVRPPRRSARFEWVLARVPAAWLPVLGGQTARMQEVGREHRVGARNIVVAPGDAQPQVDPQSSVPRTQVLVCSRPGRGRKLARHEDAGEDDILPQQRREVDAIGATDAITPAAADRSRRGNQVRVAAHGAHTPAGGRARASRGTSRRWPRGTWASTGRRRRGWRRAAPGVASRAARLRAAAGLPATALLTRRHPAPRRARHVRGRVRRGVVDHHDLPVSVGLCLDRGQSGAEGGSIVTRGDENTHARLGHAVETLGRGSRAKPPRGSQPIAPE